MYQKITLALSLSFIVMFYMTTQAQEQPATLDQQYQELKQNANDYQDYEVIKKFTLNQFWSVVQDSVNNLKSQINNLQARVDDQQNKVNEINQQMQEQKTALEESEYASTRMNFLGMLIRKDVFLTTAGTVFAILIITLAFIGIKFRMNDKLTRRKKRDFEELSAEFEEYRKIVRQREIKIKRELQTAQNKLEEQRNRQTAK
ncbi:MAG: hypothetical protein ACOCXH_12245 [Cyclobacteriaceae bacterium]